ncbi:hypothetical protein A3Q56_06480 [Intoshia linei]|uniref:DNA topoisomerase I n=1 Tax=Intoshia linei TaxID=1819745 RepID=A0A177AWQ5_9BILA|nr:hypothetical protein A3Q56_06480 [Intoshia linei]
MSEKFNNAIKETQRDKIAYKIAVTLTKHCKPFQDSLFIEECLEHISNLKMPESTKKILLKLSLSPQSITRRLDEVAGLCISKYNQILKSLKEEFHRRFSDLRKPDNVSVDYQLDVIDFQSSELLRDRFYNMECTEFYRNYLPVKYVKLKENALWNNTTNGMKDNPTQIPIKNWNCRSKKSITYIEDSDEEDKIKPIPRKRLSKNRKDLDEFDIKPKKIKKKTDLKYRGSLGESGDVKIKTEYKPNIDVKLDVKKNLIPKSNSDMKVNFKGKKGKDIKVDPKWKWWEETRQDSDVKWTFLEHKGAVFAPPYERIPENVLFYYDDKVMRLSQNTEEVATFYARMITHDYAQNEVFNRNFMNDWKKVMTQEERKIIKDLSKCNFQKIYDHFVLKSEERKAMTKEQKTVIKEQNLKLIEDYGFCIMDGHKEKIGNFRIEPPGLFRGRGNHPKMGMLKKRVEAEQVIINCSKDSKIPPPPPNHKWKEVRHDNSVSWLACWNENIQGSTKYIMLNAASKLKGEKDWKKYELSRGLHKIINKIRESYMKDFQHTEMKIRQRAVAMYFIDKLALRAGNEKDDDESADTVGCCSLRVEHIKLHETWNDQKRVIEFDFLGKDSIRYHNHVNVLKRVYKNIELFMKNKKPSDSLFDRIDTTHLNKHLNSFMSGLTAKVFRTYNASLTLSQQLDQFTEPESSIPALLLSYNRSNRAVAILCNHQRAIPKNFDKQMENLDQKIISKKNQISDTVEEARSIKNDFKMNSCDKNRVAYEKKKKAVARFKEQLNKLTVQRTDRDENKEIALGTSKLNYLDPRISVAWCKKNNVAIEKIYNKTQRDKFCWAIEMVQNDDRDFVYIENYNVNKM